MMALEADRNGLIWRQIAELLWGAGRVAEEWWPGARGHGRVKRRLASARAMLKAYRNVAAGWQ